MIFFSQAALARRSKLFRYVHFLITSVRYKSYASWKKDGEPNPFVVPNYHRPVSRQIQVSDVLHDVRLKPSRDAV